MRCSATFFVLVAFICAKAPGYDENGYHQSAYFDRAPVSEKQRSDAEMRVRKEHFVKTRIADEQEELFLFFKRVTAFSNGHISVGGRREFTRLFGETTGDEVMRNLLARPVPELLAEDIVIAYDLPFSKYVARDGTLKLPPILFGETFEIDRLTATTQQIWRQMVPLDLRRRRQPTLNSIRGLELVLEKLQIRLAETGESHSTNTMTQIRRIQKVPRRLVDGDFTDELAAYLEGYPFPGGNLSELISHMIKHQVGPRPGTEGQLLVSQLTDRMIRQAAARMGLGNPAAPKPTGRQRTTSQLTRPEPPDNYPYREPTER